MSDHIQPCSANTSPGTLCSPTVDSVEPGGLPQLHSAWPPATDEPSSAWDNLSQAGGDHMLLLFLLAVGIIALSVLYRSGFWAKASDHPKDRPIREVWHK